MSAGEIAAVVAAVAAGALVAIAAYLAVSARKVLKEVAKTTEEVRRELIPLISESRVTIHDANEKLERVDGLIDTAQSIGDRADATSKIAFTIFSNPAIKAVALGSG